MDAAAVILNSLKKPSRYALRGFTQIVPRKHSVNIAAIHRPEAFADVHGKAVGTGNDEYFVPRQQIAALLYFRQRFYKPRAGVHLLYLIAAYAAHNGAGFFAFAKAEAFQQKVLPVRHFHCI